MLINHAYTSYANCLSFSISRLLRSLLIEELRIEIEHRSPKEQVEKNIRKNLEYADTLYIITSDETAKRKVIQVALKVMFRMRKEKPEKQLKVKIASIEELKKSKFSKWFEVTNKP